MVNLICSRARDKPIFNCPRNIRYTYIYMCVCVCVCVCNRYIYMYTAKCARQGSKSGANSAG